MRCLKTDYAVRLQQEGHLRQGLLSGLWCEPQWGAGFRVELLREKGIGVSEGGGHRDLADDRCGVWKIKGETLQQGSS